MVPKKLKNQILDIFKLSKYINVLEFGANNMWFKIYVLSFAFVGFTQKNPNMPLKIIKTEALTKSLDSYVKISQIDSSFNVFFNEMLQLFRFNHYLFSSLNSKPI